MLIAMVNQNSIQGNEREAAVEALLKGSEKFLGIDINSKDYMGRSVLMNAVNNVDIEMVRHLFKIDEGKSKQPLRHYQYRKHSELHLGYFDLYLFIV